MIVLEGKNLTKTYSGPHRSVDALRQVDLTLHRGEILGVAGESGSGKSTLLRLLCGLEAPDEGQIFLNGRPLSVRRTKEDCRAMQMIFQDAPASFHPRRTAAASIRESVHSLCGKNTEPDIASLCAMVSLSEELACRLPGNLSGGQCQRLAIARAVAVQPQILLCDEITSALDVSSQAQILHLLAEICRKKNMAAVFVSHDLAVISCLCERVMVMRDGTVVEEGPVRKIIDDPEEAYTRKLIGSVMEIGREGV